MDRGERKGRTLSLLYAATATVHSQPTAARKLFLRLQLIALRTKDCHACVSSGFRYCNGLRNFAARIIYDSRTQAIDSQSSEYQQALRSVVFGCPKNPMAAELKEQASTGSQPNHTCTAHEDAKHW